MDDGDLRLDGNAAAGPLAELLGREMTTAMAVCGGCGATVVVGRLLVYDPGPGLILRCPDCDTALMRISRVREGYWLDMRGTSGVHIPNTG